MELDKCCRFCGSGVNSECSFFPLTEVQKDTLEIFANLEHTGTDGSSLVCENCVKDLKTLSEFKRCCLKVEESIAGLKPKNNDRLTLEDIVGVGLSEQEFATRMKICRFCLQMVSIDDNTRIGDSEEHLLVAVKEYIPEMNLNLIDDPVICEKCSNFITKFTAFYKFLIKTELKATEDLSETDQTGIVIEEHQIKNEAAVDAEEAIMGELRVKINQLDGEEYSFSNISEDEKVIINDINLIGGIKSENDNNAKSKYGFKENLHSNSRCEMSDSKAAVCNLTKTEISPCSEDCDSLQSEELDIKDVCLQEQEEGNENIIVDKKELVTCLIDKNGEKMNTKQCGVKEINTDKLKKSRKVRRMKNESLVTSYTNEIGETLYRCTVCPYEKKIRALVGRHVIIHVDPKDVFMYPCTYTGCTYKTKYKGNLKKHLTVHKYPKDLVMYPCTYTGCAYKTKDKGNLKTHLIVHKDPKDLVMYPCTYTGCTYKTKGKGNLKTHLIVHKDPKDVIMYPCTYTGCTYKTKYKHILPSHQISHRDPKDVAKYPCTYTGCTYKTNIKCSLSSHLIAHRDLKDVVMYPCTYTGCTYKAKYKTNLTSHVLHRHAIKEFKCNLCSVQTITKSALLAHLANFHTETKFMCAHCSFSANYKGYLRNHIIICHQRKEMPKDRKNAKEGQLKCDQCFFQCKSKQYFKNHLKIHESNREMLSCNECSYQTRHINGLNRHRITHENNPKTYSCSKCSYRTKWKNNIKQHKVIHENNRKMYTCSQCPYQAKWKHTIDNHKAVQHGIS